MAKKKQEKKAIRKKEKKISKPVKPAAPKQGKWQVWAAMAVIAILVFIVYAPSLKNQWTNWDDPTYVLENEKVKNLDWETIKYFFDTDNPVSLNYHPLTMISLTVDYAIADSKEKKTKGNLYPGYNAKTYHYTNLILHLLNSILVFLFIFFLNKKKILPAIIVAVLFGIHPMHVESVAWISERKDVLYTFFFLSSLILYVKYLDKYKLQFIVFAFVLFLLSLLSKGVAVVLPIVFIAIDFYKGRKFDKRAIIEKIPFLALSIYFGLLAMEIQSGGAIAKEGVISYFNKFVFAGYGFMMYIYHLIIPLKLATFYPYPFLTGSGGLPSKFYILAVSASIIGIASIISLRKTKLVFFGMIFYLITVALVLQFITVGRAIMADRYTYIPYIGLLFIMAYGFDYLWENKEQKLKWLRYPAAILLAGWTIWLGYLGHEQTKVWENSGTLWTQTIDNYPAADVAYKNRGNFYGQNGQPDKAMRDYDVLVANNDVDSQVWGNIGNIHRMRNNIDKAHEAYSKQIEMGSDLYKGYINRGITFSIKKDYPSALEDFQKALELGAPLHTVAINRAYTYLYSGKYQESVKDYDYLIKINPFESALFQNRGLAKYNQKQYPEAIVDFESALKLTQNKGSLLYNISVCYFQMKDMAKAKDYAQKAAAAGYSVPQEYMNGLQ
ncbi:MAG: tetratricopeptide repeat protein [Bacteroidota bacterium]|nr:tetratricopeptide repeat protein [Bacteroidota bacterium]